MNTAPVKWAQRADSVYLTIDLRDISDEKLDLTADKLIFNGKSGDKEYSLELEFLHPVKPSDSTWNVLPRSIQMHIIKEEESDTFWERLLKDKILNKSHVKIDWDKYIDEDDEQESFDMGNMAGGSGFGGGGGGPPGMGGAGGMGGMDMQQMMSQMGGAGGMGGGGMGGMDMQQMMSQMGGMGGMGGMPGGEDDLGDDSDDEDLPDLDLDEDEKKGETEAEEVN